jgi:phosphatidylglycerophosphatase A
VADHLATIIATGFYSGTIYFFPGFWGAGLGLLLWFCCRELSLTAYLGVAAGLFVTGVWAAGKTERIYAQPDAKPIVIDETLGVFIALVSASCMRFGWLGGFLIFLALDGVKPFPASWVDTNISGGLGIMMDDVVAGFYALFLLLVVRRLIAGRQGGSRDHQSDA